MSWFFFCAGVQTEFLRYHVYMILYPTETLYALGVNALDRVASDRLYALKGRDTSKVASWLVRNEQDIERFAEMNDVSRRIVAEFMPGPVTLVLPVRDKVPNELVGSDRTIGFRISSDPMAQTIIDAFFAEYDAPLTCTSANVSGAPTLPTVPEILQQFGGRAGEIDEIHDDGPRKALASTVVRVVGGEIIILREGVISEDDLRGRL